MTQGHYAKDDKGEFFRELESTKRCLQKGISGSATFCSLTRENRDALREAFFEGYIIDETIQRGYPFPEGEVRYSVSLHKASKSSV